MKKSFLTIGIATILSFNAMADERTITDNLKKVNNGRFADTDINILREAPVASLKGFYEITIDGQPIVVDPTGKFGIIGDIYDLDKMLNLSAEKRTEIMKVKAKQEIESFPENNFVTYSPSKKVIGTLYAYTDPTCGYCKKLHSEIEQYLNAGVEVKYVPYPRGGVNEGASGYEKTKQIMCAKDKQDAMTKIKNGVDNGSFVKNSYDRECVNLVKNGIDSGSKIGLTGTPFLYLSNGDIIPGYEPASKVIRRLKK